MTFLFRGNIMEKRFAQMARRGLKICVLKRTPQMQTTQKKDDGLGQTVSNSVTLNLSYRVCSPPHSIFLIFANLRFHSSACFALFYVLWIASAISLCRHRWWWWWCCRTHSPLSWRASPTTGPRLLGSLSLRVSSPSSFDSLRRRPRMMIIHCPPRF